MFERAHLRSGLKVLALFLAAMVAACTSQSDPTGVDDQDRNGPGEVIEAGQLAG